MLMKNANKANQYQQSTMVRNFNSHH